MNQPAMTGTRRALLALAASTAVTSVFSSAAMAADKTQPAIKAVAFDAFPIFDPRSISLRAEEVFPGRGGALVDVWRTRQFEYTWLRIASQRYADFWHVTEDALVFAAKLLKLDLTSEKRSRLMGSYLEMKPWPGVAEGLKTLRDAGLRLRFLSNLTPQMLAACVKASALEGLFEDPLSTDTIRTYKPDPRAYAMAVDAFGLPVENILFVAFGGWDAVGAKTFGFKTFWFNPASQPTEELGVTPDAMGLSFTDLVRFLLV